MAFKSIYAQKAKIKANNSGSPKHAIYRLAKDKDMNDVLELDHYEDLQKIIDSYADQVSIVRILERHAAGDPTALAAKSVLWTDHDVDLQFANGKTPEELSAEQSLTVLKLYNDFSGKDNVSLDEFKNLVLAGKFKELEKYTTKKEEELNG